jgi:hypothetical protein
MVVTRQLYENGGAVTGVYGGTSYMTLRYMYNYVSLD